MENYDCAGNCIVEVDCAGVCGGSSEVDECGECGGEETNEDNCLPECENDEYLDACYNCILFGSPFFCLLDCNLNGPGDEDYVQLLSSQEAPS